MLSLIEVTSMWVKGHILQTRVDRWWACGMKMMTIKNANRHQQGCY